MTGVTRRIWSEFVSYQTLTSERVIRLLRGRQLQLLVAVKPDDLDSLGGLIECYAEADVALGLWPMVDDADGRWGSTFNAQLYSDFVLQVADFAPEGTTIAIDLEPPITLVRGLLAGAPGAYQTLFRGKSWSAGHAILHALLVSLRRRGHKTIAAVNPLLLGDGRGESTWQWLFGTPIDTLPFDAVSFMAYTSLLEGYSRGLIPRRVARSLLVQTAMGAHRHWGAQASISIGTVGGGALGDERPYRDVSELIADVSLVRRCGIEDLALFDLSGVLESSNPEAWIDAFVCTPASTSHPDESRRACILKGAVKLCGSMIARYRREPSRWD